MKILCFARIKRLFRIDKIFQERKKCISRKNKRLQRGEPPRIKR